MITVVTLAERPDLVSQVFSVADDWPAFMLQDPIGGVFYGRLAAAFPEFQLMGLDDAGAPVAKLHSIPFRWDGSDAGLPDRGWEAVLQQGFNDRDAGREPNAVSFLEALIAPTLRGRGFSTALVKAGRDNASRHGFVDVFAPVRPAHKARQPRTSMASYAARVRDDGLPSDPWLRVHVRLGARIVKVCPLSMVIPGTLAQWRQWTGQPFDVPGDTEIDGALVPVHVSVDNDYAVYVEPNVWVHHNLA
ncbi:MAG: N-acetyltransferase [Actinomycetes bacterium]